MNTAVIARAADIIARDGLDPLPTAVHGRSIGAAMCAARIDVTGKHSTDDCQADLVALADTLGYRTLAEARRHFTTEQIIALMREAAR